MSVNNDYVISFQDDNSTQRKTLVLDLDETLIHTREEMFGGAMRVKSQMAAYNGFYFYLSQRPGLNDFLTNMSKYYNLVLYTAATRQYADTVLKVLQIEDFFSGIYHRDHCVVNSKQKRVKNLSILKIPLANLLLLDDSEVHVPIQPDNILTIKPFKGEVEDKELHIISGFLTSLSQKNDLRPVMEHFEKYRLQSEFENNKKKNILVLDRGFNAKFLQKLNICARKKIAMNAVSPDFNEEDCDSAQSKERFEDARDSKNSKQQLSDVFFE